MTLRRGCVILALQLAAACTGERPPSDAIHRSETAPLPALPEDATALARLLGVPAESLRAAGEERYVNQSFDSARGIWRVELARSSAAADTAAEARVLMWLGLSAWRLGDYAAARREGEAALQLKRRAGLDAELSRSFNALGLLAWNEGRHHDALAHFDSAAASARRNEDEAGIARATGNVALVEIELGNFDAARAALDEAFEVGVRVGDERIQANALTNMAMVEVRSGNHARALDILGRSRARYAAMGYATGEANALGQAATAWLGLGELQRALAAADSMLAIARAQGLQQQVAAALEILADVNATSGNARAALRQLATADSIDEALGLAVERGINLRRTAAILQDLNETGPSVNAARKALDVHRESDARTEMVYDLLQLASSHRSAGDLHAAQSAADSAARLATDQMNTGALREMALVRAQIALDQRNPRRALALLDEVRRSDLASDWPLTDLKAEALVALGRMEPAREEAERAVEQLERQRGSLALDAGVLRSIYMHQRSTPYARLVRIHLARKDVESAFRVAASVPGRTLAERAHAAGLRQGERTTAETTLLRIAALERQLGELGSDEHDADRRRGLERALATVRTDYEQELARASASPVEGRASRPAVAISDAQRRLALDEGLLLTLVGPESLYLFAVRADTVVSRSVAIGGRMLAHRVRVARELMASGRDESGAALSELRAVLFPPGIDSALRNASRLLVVPHGVLAALPFAALRDARAGRYLAEQFVLSYVPAMSMLLEDRRARSFNDLAIFAPLTDSLPGTGREAASIARLVGGAQVFAGSRSTETQVRAALRAGRAVHVASHGVHDAANPLFSRMRVGRRTRAADGPNDGSLEVHEILEMWTDSPLVFLSGCETGVAAAGQSPFQQASDESSLANALVIAGARTVVATFWRVGDSTAAAMAESFYAHLEAGLAPDVALSMAQRDAVKHRGVMTWAAYGVFDANPRKAKSASRISGNQP